MDALLKQSLMASVGMDALKTEPALPPVERRFPLVLLKTTLVVAKHRKN